MRGIVAGITERDMVEHWPLVPPLRLEPFATGVNNRSWLVTSGDGAYVLKRYRNVTSPDRLPFEHKLLRALNMANLPFAVPAPLPSRLGDTTVEFERGEDVCRVSLFHQIRGRAAEFGSTADACRCGEALAILHGALDAVRLDAAVSVPGTYGALASAHPLIHDPVIAARRILEDDPLAAGVADVMLLLEERWPRDTSGLKTQLIHSDFYPTNTLMDAGEVTGILDFEYSGLGYRAMDFATGLQAFSTKNWHDGCSWPLLESFARGYLERAPLAEQELAATPVLLLMREATSFVHWMGRLKQGLTTHADIHDRALGVMGLHRWLERNQEQLVHRLGVINESQGDTRPAR